MEATDSCRSDNMNWRKSLLPGDVDEHENLKVEFMSFINKQREVDRAFYRPSSAGAQEGLSVADKKHFLAARSLALETLEAAVIGELDRDIRFWRVALYRCVVSLREIDAYIKEVQGSMSTEVSMFSLVEA